MQSAKTISPSQLNIHHAHMAQTTSLSRSTEYVSPTILIDRSIIIRKCQIFWHHLCLISSIMSILIYSSEGKKRHLQLWNTKQHFMDSTFIELIGKTNKQINLQR